MTEFLMIILANQIEAQGNKSNKTVMKEAQEHPQDPCDAL